MAVPVDSGRKWADTSFVTRAGEGTSQDGLVRTR
jgi:hypothetical protein